MRKQSILIGTVLLAIGGIIAKAIGAFYKIPLSNILGSSGMGIYYLVFPLYSFLLVVVSSGVSFAVSKMVAQARAKQNYCDEKTILNSAIVIVIILSMFFAVLTMLLSKTLSFYQGNSNAYLSYIAIAPAIIFASLIAVLRGYFQGLENMIPTSFSNIFEQIIKLVFGLFFANFFLDSGIMYAVLGATLGVTISEFLALVILSINYIFYYRKNNFFKKAQSGCKASFKEISKNLIKLAFPATLCGIVMPITGLLDSFMVINLLKSSGFTSVLSTSLYGINSGIVNTLVNIPVILIISLSTAIVPNVSVLVATNQVKEMEFRTAFFIKISLLISIPCFVFMVICSPEIISILFNKSLTNIVINEFEFAYKLLMISSVSIIYYSLLQTVSSILQSINKVYVSFLSLFVALIVRTIFVVFLVKIPTLNIFGVAIANIVFLNVALLLNVIFIKKYINIKFALSKILISPIMCGLIMGCCMIIIREFLIAIVPTYVTIVICGLIGLIIYLLLVFAFKCFNSSESKIILKKIHR